MSAPSQPPFPWCRRRWQGGWRSPSASAFALLGWLPLVTLLFSGAARAADRPKFLDVSHLFPEWTNSAPSGTATNAPQAGVPLTTTSSAAPASPPVEPPAPAPAVIPAPAPVPPVAAASLPESPAAGNAPANLSAVTASNGMDALDDKHRLAIGDRLSFRIMEDEEESKPLYVTDSGEVEVPLLGRFPALGKSCQDLARALKTELEKEYYYQATVILAVDVMAKSRGKVYLVGPVRAPGPQEIPSDEVLTLSKAVLRAGGFTDYADKKNVKVTRKSADAGTKDQTFTVNVGEIIERGRTDSDLPLEPGDLVYVPERLIRF